MKKIILIMCMILLVGCAEEPEEVIDEPVVIELDDDSYHNTKLTTHNNSIPHLINTSIEMDDDIYGSYIIEMIDAKFEKTWTYKWRDLEKNDENYALKPLIYEDLMIVNVQGVVSVHDLLTGQFKWELETSGLNGFAVQNDILYVMFYNDDFITGVDLETGEKILHIEEAFMEMNDLYIDETIVAFYKSTVRSEKNAVEYSLDGEFIGRLHHTSVPEKINTWDAAESSDESESASLVIDGSMKTLWAESVKSYGEKEWIEVTRQLPTLVHKLILYNGNHTSKKDFDENPKLKRAVISIGDGKSFIYVFESFEFMTPDVIEFVKPIAADYILITIEEAEPGTLFKNTGITELYTQ